MYNLFIFIYIIDGVNHKPYESLFVISSVTISRLFQAYMDGNQGQSRKSERHLARKGISLVRVSDRCDRLRRRRFRISLSLPFSTHLPFSRP